MVNGIIVLAVIAALTLSIIALVKCYKSDFEDDSSHCTSLDCFLPEGAINRCEAWPDCECTKTKEHPDITQCEPKSNN